MCLIISWLRKTGADDGFGFCDELLGFGAGDKDVRGDAELAAAELLDAGDVLQRLAGGHAGNGVLKAGKRLGGHGVLRLDDMRIALGPKDMGAQTQNEAPCLLWRVQSLERSGALPYKAGKQH